MKVLTSASSAAAVRLFLVVTFSVSEYFGNTGTECDDRLMSSFSLKVLVSDLVSIPVHDIRLHL